MTQPCISWSRSMPAVGVTRHTAFEPPSGMSLFLSCCAHLQAGGLQAAVRGVAGRGARGCRPRCAGLQGAVRGVAGRGARGCRASVSSSGGGAREREAFVEVATALDLVRLEVGREHDAQPG